MTGLERGTVKLIEYRSEWPVIAKEHIKRIRCALGDAALDIQHVGSTAIPGLCAKPIIDMAVGVQAFDEQLVCRLESAGYSFRPAHDSQPHMLFVDGQGDMRYAHIHVVKYMDMEWRNYVNFRDYLYTFSDKRDAYARLKTELAAKYPNDRERYTEAKADFIRYTLRKAMVWSYLGKQIEAEVDRPVGYLHQKGEKQLLYPINYGFIPGVLGGDDEELDVYFLGTNQPLQRFSGKVIAIAHRTDDVEDKLIACPQGLILTGEEICREIYFQEKYYDTTVELLNGQKLHITNGGA